MVISPDFSNNPESLPSSEKPLYHCRYVNNTWEPQYYCLFYVIGKTLNEVQNFLCIFQV
jgi:hypothetical protein